MDIGTRRSMVDTRVADCLSPDNRKGVTPPRGARGPTLSAEQRALFSFDTHMVLNGQANLGLGRLQRNPDSQDCVGGRWQKSLVLSSPLETFPHTVRCEVFFSQVGGISSAEVHVFEARDTEPRCPSASSRAAGQREAGRLPLFCRRWCRDVWLVPKGSCRATRACFSRIVYTCICPPAGRGLQLAGLDKEGGGEMLFLLYILTNV